MKTKFSPSTKLKKIFRKIFTNKNGIVSFKNREKNFPLVKRIALFLFEKKKQLLVKMKIFLYWKKNKWFSIWRDFYLEGKSSSSKNENVFLLNKQNCFHCEKKILPYHNRKIVFIFKENFYLVKKENCAHCFFQRKRKTPSSKKLKIPPSKNVKHFLRKTETFFLPNKIEKFLLIKKEKFPPIKKTIFQKKFLSKKKFSFSLEKWNKMQKHCWIIIIIIIVDSALRIKMKWIILQVDIKKSGENFVFLSFIHRGQVWI